MEGLNRAYVQLFDHSAFLAAQHLSPPLTILRIPPLDWLAAVLGHRFFSIIVGAYSMLTKHSHPFDMDRMFSRFHKISP
jgi:hypothetical protein